MRRIHFLGVFVAVTAIGGGALYGCSAGANDVSNDNDSGGGAAEAGDDSTVSGDDSGGGGGDDSGNVTKDSGPKDAGPDVKMKPDVGPPGSPCNPIGKNQNDPNGCGLCGQEARVCLAGDAGAGVDAGVWSDWGACTGQVTGPDACDPSIADAGVVPCGMCGHRQVICQTDCHLNNTLVCQGQPANACTPADTKFTLAVGCSNPNQGRTQTCGNDCQWGSPSACMDPPPNPNAINASNTSGGVASKQFALSASKTYARDSIGSCPTTLDQTTVSPYIYVQINNTDTVSHQYEVWGSATSGGPVIDTIMTAYGAVVPQSDNDRQACVGKVKDTCSTTTPALSPACSGQWAGLVGADAITVPAGGQVQTYTAAYFDGSGGETITGNFMLNVRTK